MLAIGSFSELFRYFPQTHFRPIREHPHFVVIRPIGHPGRLMQVLDPNLEPIVLDGADLTTGGGRTGLVPTPSHPRWIFGWLALAPTSVALLSLNRNLRRVALVVPTATGRASLGSDRLAW